MPNSITSADLYDVVAVDLTTRTVRFMATGKDLRNAEAIVTMTVMRRGVEKELFAEVKTGMYQEGDTWTGRGADG